MRLKYTIMVLAAGALLMIVACSRLPDDNNGLFGNFDQAAMLTNIGNNVLLSSITNFSGSASATATAIAAFTANPDSTTLAAAQTAWQTMAQSWAAAAPFDFGPMNDDLISANVDTWPANDTKIESAVAAQSNAANVGADTKGLKGLEYLLFDAKGNDAVLAKYAGADSVNRKAFLNSIAQNLVTEATQLQSAWSGGYLNSFVTADGNDVSSSVSQLVNGIAIYLDNIKNMKVGNPIGMGVKVNDGTAHPDLIEYTIAEQSLPVLIANIQAMKYAFDGGPGQGLDDLLNYTMGQSNNTQTLSVIVDNQFVDVITKLQAINPPYSMAVSDQTQQVQEVFDSLKILIAYFKVDIANRLGVTITFTDTDGD